MIEDCTFLSSWPPEDFQGDSCSPWAQRLRRAQQGDEGSEEDCRETEACRPRGGRQGDPSARDPPLQASEESFQEQRQPEIECSEIHPEATGHRQLSEVHPRFTAAGGDC